MRKGATDRSGRYADNLSADLIARDKGERCFSSQLAFRDKSRLTLEGKLDAAGHGLTPEQRADAGVIRRGSGLDR